MTRVDLLRTRLTRMASRSLKIRLVPNHSWVVVLAAVVFLTVWCCASVRSGFSANDAEPEILNQIWRLARGESIYRDIKLPPFVFAAYPPLYYALAALVTKIVGLSYLPAKLISLIAAFAVGWAIYFSNRAWNRPLRRELWPAFFLFLAPAFLYNSIRCHPQMMALAFSLWSLVFFMRDRWWEALIISPLLAACAFYTKQTQVALPAAIVLYLALRNRRYFLPYAGVLALAILVPFFLLQRLTHGLFFLDVVELAKLDYDIWTIPSLLYDLIGPVFILVALAFWQLSLRFRLKRWDVVDIYFVVIFLTTIVSLGRIGADGQYVIELLAVSFLYVLRSADLPNAPLRDWMLNLQIVFLLVGTPWFVGHHELPANFASCRAANKVYPMLRTAPGPMLSRQGSFPLFTTGELSVQLFHFAALGRAGLWDQNLLLQEVDRREFTWVISQFQLDGPILHRGDKERFSPELLEALQKNYYLKKVISPYYLYRPRGSVP